MFDLKAGEILVAEEFWNFLACGDVYEDLLDVFQETGEELRPELDKKFAEFQLPPLKSK